jgi:hypothetical protein
VIRDVANISIKAIIKKFAFLTANVASANFSKRYRYSMHISYTIAFMLKFDEICRSILIEKQRR